MAAGPALSTVWLISSFIITSWLIGMRAMRSRRISKRASSSSRGGASVARPHATASRPFRQSPVKSRRLAFSMPMRNAQTAVVGTPQTRAGG